MSFFDGMSRLAVKSVDSERLRLLARGSAKLEFLSGRFPGATRSLGDADAWRVA